MTILPIRTGSDGNIYILTTSNNNRFLIECGISKMDTQKILRDLGLSISDFEGCFISHSHSDHCESIKWVAKYMPIFTNNQVRDKNKTINNIFVLPATKIYTIKDLKIIPFNLEHGNAENYGYMFKDEKDTMLFATDFRECYSNVFNNLFDEVFIECNWNKELIEDYTNEVKENRQINTHLSLDITSVFIQKLNLQKCRKITLIHPSDTYCNKNYCLKVLREKFPNVEIDFAKNLI